jgi:hypothetical protein
VPADTSRARTGTAGDSDENHATARSAYSAVRDKNESTVLVLSRRQGIGLGFGIGQSQIIDKKI